VVRREVLLEVRRDPSAHHHWNQRHSLLYKGATYRNALAPDKGADCILLYSQQYSTIFLQVTLLYSFTLLTCMSVLSNYSSEFPLLCCSNSHYSNVQLPITLLYSFTLFCLISSYYYIYCIPSHYFIVFPQINSLSSFTLRYSISSHYSHVFLYIPSLYHRWASLFIPFALDNFHFFLRQHMNKRQTFASMMNK
jgi:hypothetical protein